MPFFFEECAIYGAKGGRREPFLDILWFVKESTILYGAPMEMSPMCHPDRYHLFQSQNLKAWINSNKINYIAWLFSFSCFYICAKVISAICICSDMVIQIFSTLNLIMCRVTCVSCTKQKQQSKHSAVQWSSIPTMAPGFLGSLQIAKAASLNSDDAKLMHSQAHQECLRFQKLMTWAGAHCTEKDKSCNWNRQQFRWWKPAETYHRTC